MLVADVARRRPLLTRDVLRRPRALARAYVQAACAAAARRPLHGADVVMTTPDLALGRSGVRSLRSRTSSCSTRRSPRAMWAGLAAAAPDAWPARALGRRRGRVRRPGPRDASSTSTRPCGASGGPSPPAPAGLTMPSSRNFLGAGAVLAPVAAVAAAVRALREAGLLVARTRRAATISNGRRVRSTSPGRTLTETWHNRYQTPDFLQTCLTAQL